MSKQTTAFIITADLVAATSGQNRTQAIEAAVKLVTLAPNLLGQSLTRRAALGEIMSKPARVASSVSQETLGQLNRLTNLTGLSLNQIVALALEAHLLEKSQ